MNVATPTDTSVQRARAAHLLRDADVQPDELAYLLELAARVKAEPEAFHNHLHRRSTAVVFEKPSLRTRVTFEIAIQQLGGIAVHLDHRDGRIGEREPARDIARNLERWCDAVVARTYAQQTLEELSRWSKVPIINALSGHFHPCQAFADLLTLKEHKGRLAGLKIAYIGDGNNVAASLMLNAAKLGVSVSIATPKGYEPRIEVLEQANLDAGKTGATVEVVREPIAAVEGAAAIYTDVWTSMGWESETQARRILFADYQVNDALMKQALPDALFMHCLPAVRGDEVTDSVIESPQSVVFDQAENRLHTSKAVLLMFINAAL